MKQNILILAILLLGSTSCQKDFLNEPPLDRITESDVWSDRDLMDTYLFKIYDNMPWDYLKDFGGGAGWGAHRDALTDLAMSTYSWTPANNTIRLGNWGTSTNYWPLDWWGYFNIWKINYALENKLLEQADADAMHHANKLRKKAIAVDNFQPGEL